MLAGAAVRDGLVRVGVTAIPPLFLCSLAAGIGVPIMLYHVARRVPLLSVAATGERWIGVAGRSRQMAVAAVAP